MFYLLDISGPAFTSWPWSEHVRIGGWDEGVEEYQVSRFLGAQCNTGSDHRVIWSTEHRPDLLPCSLIDRTDKKSMVRLTPLRMSLNDLEMPNISRTVHYKLHRQYFQKRKPTKFRPLTNDPRRLCQALRKLKCFQASGTELYLNPSNASSVELLFLLARIDLQTERSTSTTGRGRFICHTQYEMIDKARGLTVVQNIA